MPVTMVDNYL